MAHTITTLRAHRNPSVAGYACNVESLLSWGDVRSSYVRENLLCFIGFSARQVTDLDAWAALRGYAMRALCAMTAPKQGMIVVNGAACLVPQTGERLTVDYGALGAHRLVGNGAFLV